MNLQRRGDKNVLRQRIDRYGVRQHGAHHRRLIRAGGGFDARQRKARGIRHRDTVGRGNETMPHRLHSGIRRETRAIERRHAMLARTRKRVGGRQLCFRKARLQPMLAVAQFGEKEQIWPQRVAFCERSEPLAAAGEHRKRVGQSREGRLDHLPDRNRVMPWRTQLSHKRTSRTARAT